MYPSQGRFWLTLVGLVLACCAGCTQPPQKSAYGNLPTHAGANVEPRVNATTYFAHGHLLERQGQFERAVVQYRKALALQPDFLSARNRLGITLNKLGRNGEASDQFRRAVAGHPELAYLHNNLGFSLYLEEYYDQAQEAFQQALELRPDFPRAHTNYALVLARLGRFDEAFSELSLVGSEADACFNMGIILTEAERYAEAAHYLEAALAVRPNFPAARQQLREVSRLAAELEARQTAEVAAAEAASGTREAAPETPVAPETHVATEATTPETMEAVGVAAAATPAGEAPAEAKPADHTGGERTTADETGTRAAPEGRTVTEAAVTEQTAGQPAPADKILVQPSPPPIASDESEPSPPARESMMDTDLLSFMVAQAWAAFQAPLEEPAEEATQAFGPEPDAEQAIAMIDEALTALLNWSEEFDGLWCRVGYYLFPETAPDEPLSETEWSAEQDEFLDAVRDAAIGK